MSEVPLYDSRSNLVEEGVELDHEESHPWKPIFLENRTTKLVVLLVIMKHSCSKFRCLVLKEKPISADQILRGAAPPNL